jgi:hypothetical protein
MNKKILPAAVAAFCAIGVLHTGAYAGDKSKKQLLSDLSCLAGQVAEFDGDLWACIDTPSGSGGESAEYQFVGDDGTILGDVTYIEDGFTAWGYINDMSTSSTIQVTATFTKTSRGTRLAGNVKSTRVYYKNENCNGLPYHRVADEVLNVNYRGVSEPVAYPPFLAFLETEPVYFLPDDHTAPTTWTEVILDTNEEILDFASSNRTTDPGHCYNYVNNGVLVKAVEFGDPVAAPVMPILVVKK